MDHIDQPGPHVQTVLARYRDLLADVQHIFEKANNGDRDKAIANYTRQAILRVCNHRVCAIHLPEVFLASIACGQLRTSSNTMRVCWDAIPYEERQSIQLRAVKCVLDLYDAQIKDYLERNKIKVTSAKIDSIQWKETYAGAWQIVNMQGSLSLPYLWTTRLGNGLHDLVVVCDVEEEPDDSDDEEDDSDDEEDDSDDEEEPIGPKRPSIQTIEIVVDLCLSRWSRTGNIPLQDVNKIHHTVYEVCQRKDFVDGDLISYTNKCYGLFVEYCRYITISFQAEQAQTLISTLRRAFHHIDQSLKSMQYRHYKDTVSSTEPSEFLCPGQDLKTTVSNIMKNRDWKPLYQHKAGSVSTQDSPEVQEHALQNNTEEWLDVISLD